MINEQSTSLFSRLVGGGGEELHRFLNIRVIQCLTRNPKVLCRPALDLLGFHWSVLWQGTSESQPSTGETQERHE